MSLIFTLTIPVNDRADAAVGAVLDFRGRGLNSQIEVSGGFGARDFCVERAPLRAHLAALHAEALLNAGAATVESPRIDGHVARVHLLIAEFFRARIHDFEIVRSRQTGNAVAARHAETTLRDLVIPLEFFVRNRPVDQRSAGNISIGGFHT